MSMLIKGMKMPKSCRDCWIEQEGFRCGGRIECPDTTCFDSERREDCPLVEIPPHGRLIDAYALMDKLSRMFSERERDAQYSGERVVNLSWNDAIFAILSAPTIIEGDQ